MDLETVRKKYFEQLAGKEGYTPKEFDAVFNALQPMFSLSATPENVWDAQHAALNAWEKVSLSEVGTFSGIVLGAIVGIGDVLMNRYKKINLSLWESEFHFLDLNHITDPSAIEAIRSGEATIGLLLEIQPSIFCK